MGTPAIITLSRLQQNPDEFVRDAQGGVAITRHGRFVAIASRVDTVDQGRTLAAQCAEEGICEEPRNEWSMSLDEFVGYIESGSIKDLFQICQLIFVGANDGIIAVMPFVMGVESVLLSRMIDDLELTIPKDASQWRTADELLAELGIEE